MTVTTDEDPSVVAVIRREAAFRYLCVLHEMAAEETPLSPIASRTLRQESAEIMADLLFRRRPVEVS